MSSQTFLQRVHEPGLCFNITNYNNFKIELIQKKDKVQKIGRYSGDQD